MRGTGMVKEPANRYWLTKRMSLL